MARKPKKIITYKWDITEFSPEEYKSFLKLQEELRKIVVSKRPSTYSSRIREAKRKKKEEERKKKEAERKRR